MAFEGKGCAGPNPEEVSYLVKIAGPPSCSVLPGSAQKSSGRKSRPTTRDIDTSPAPCEAPSIATDDSILISPSEVIPDKMTKPLPCPPDKKATIKVPPPRSKSPPPKRKPPAKAKSKSPAKKRSASVQAPTPSTCNLRREEEPVSKKKSDKKIKKKVKSRDASPSPSGGGCSGGGSSRGSSPGKKKRRGV